MESRCETIVTLLTHLMTDSHVGQEIVSHFQGSARCIETVTQLKKVHTNFRSYVLLSLSNLGLLKEFNIVCGNKSLSINASFKKDFSQHRLTQLLRD